MENKNEEKYYFIWLYISLLLHLLLVIIMLTIKPNTSTDPDPGQQIIDPTQIIFIHNQKEVQTDPEEVQPYQMAQKIQGLEHGTTDDCIDVIAQPINDFNIVQEESSLKSPDTEHKLDTSTKALTDEYKKGLKDLTTVQDQQLADINIQEKVSASETQDTLEQEETVEEIAKQSIENIEEPHTHKVISQPEMQHENSVESIFKTLNQLEQNVSTQSKQTARTAVAIAKKVSSQPTPKIDSKKHRPIEVGAYNQSKLELNKETIEYNQPKKKKASLLDLNLEQGFSDFIRKGNAAFSSDGNADVDNEMGLKRISYMTQIRKMYDTAASAFPIPSTIKEKDSPIGTSTVIITIERSGKVSSYKLLATVSKQECNTYHMNMVKFMGDFPPIPQYMEAPIVCKFDLQWKVNGVSAYYRPSKLQI